MKKENVLELWFLKETMKLEIYDDYGIGFEGMLENGNTRTYNHILKEKHPFIR